jgi:hypothetical protein
LYVASTHNPPFPNQPINQSKPTNQPNKQPTKQTTNQPNKQTNKQRMTAYEDPTGKLRTIAYPDNHQGYGRIQLDQVIDTKVRAPLSVICLLGSLCVLRDVVIAMARGVNCCCHGCC